jgi:hypothetical protein
VILTHIAFTSTCVCRWAWHVPVPGSCSSCGSGRGNGRPCLTAAYTDWEADATIGSQRLSQYLTQCTLLMHRLQMTRHTYTADEEVYPPRSTHPLYRHCLSGRGLWHRRLSAGTHLCRVCPRHWVTGTTGLTHTQTGTLPTTATSSTVGGADSAGVHHTGSPALQSHQGIWETQLLSEATRRASLMVSRGQGGAQHRGEHRSRALMCQGRTRAGVTRVLPGFFCCPSVTDLGWPEPRFRLVFCFV